MNIEGVPDSIPWETVKTFLESLGLDLGRVPADTGGILITGSHIRATVYALNAEGDMYIDLGTDPPEPATHEVCIPITRAEA